eukprot:468273_1
MTMHMTPYSMKGSQEKNCVLMVMRLNFWVVHLVPKKKKEKKIDGIAISDALGARGYACCDKSNDSTFIDDLVCVWEGDDDMQFQWYTVGYDNGNGHAKIVEGVQYLCCDEDSKRK